MPERSNSHPNLPSIYFPILSIYKLILKRINFDKHFSNYMNHGLFDKIDIGRTFSFSRVLFMNGILQ